jgi:deoxyribonuclease-4
MHKLGIRWTVVHPGHHMGMGYGEASVRIAGALDSILKGAPAHTGILLENTAGQGTSVGRSLTQLQEILDRVSQPDRMGACFDTCHAFASGMDLSSRTGVDAVMEDMERTVGLERVRAFHLNDSLGELGSHRDRHATLGKGNIGLDPLRYMVSLDIFRECPGIVEAPGTDNDRARQARELLS